MEELIKEYTRTVPADVRLCADMNNTAMCFEAMNTTTDSVLLINFMHFHVLQMSVYSCLLRPRALSDQGQQILSVVQEHSLSKALKSCQLMLRAIHRLAVTDATSCEYMMFCNYFNIHSYRCRQLPDISKRILVSRHGRTHTISDVIQQTNCKRSGSNDEILPKGTGVDWILSGQSYAANRYNVWSVQCTKIYDEGWQIRH